MNAREGFVKFTVNHHEAALPQHGGMSALVDVRNQLFARGLIGLNAHGIGFGNVSTRYDQNGGFIISGTGTGGVARLGLEGYCLVSECELCENRVVSHGPVAASSESMTHYVIYAARPDVACVIHVHSRALFDTLIARKMPQTPSEAAYGTLAMAHAVQALVVPLTETGEEAEMDTGIFVMRGHDEGVIVYGPDCATAYAALHAALAYERNEGSA